MNRKTRLNRTPMKRKKPKPKTPAKRKRDRERKKREFARKYGSERRVRLVQAMPCVVPSCRRAPSENAHIETEGMGRKAHHTKTVPLCAHHHRLGDTSLHHLARAPFEALHGVDLESEARRTARACETYTCPEDPSLGLIPGTELTDCTLCEDDGEPCRVCGGVGQVVGYRPNGPGSIACTVLTAVPVPTDVEV